MKLSRAQLRQQRQLLINELQNIHNVVTLALKLKMDSDCNQQLSKGEKQIEDLKCELQGYILMTKPNYSQILDQQLQHYRRVFKQLKSQIRILQKQPQINDMKLNNTFELQRQISIISRKFEKNRLKIKRIEDIISQKRQSIQILDARIANIQPVVQPQTPGMAYYNYQAIKRKKQILVKVISQQQTTNTRIYASKVRALQKVNQSIQFLNQKVIFLSQKNLKSQQIPKNIRKVQTEFSILTNLPKKIKKSHTIKPMISNTRKEDRAKIQKMKRIVTETDQKDGYLPEFFSLSKLQMQIDQKELFNTETFEDLRIFLQKPKLILEDQINLQDILYY